MGSPSWQPFTSDWYGKHQRRRNSLVVLFDAGPFDGVMLIPLEALQHCGFVRQEPRRTDTLGRDVTGLTGLHDDSDWIEWRGGEQPIDAFVEIQFRDGSVGTDEANRLYWKHDNDFSDIIAYRVVAKEQM